MVKLVYENGMNINSFVKSKRTFFKRMIIATVNCFHLTLNKALESEYQAVLNCMKNLIGNRDEELFISIFYVRRSRDRKNYRCISINVFEECLRWFHWIISFMRRRGTCFQSERLAKIIQFMRWAFCIV